MPSVSFSQFSGGQPVTVVGNEGQIQSQEAQTGPSFFQQLKDFSIGASKEIGREVLSAGQNLQTIGQGAMLLGGASPETVSKTGFKSLDSNSPQGKQIEQTLVPYNETQKYGGYSAIGGEILATGGENLVKDAIGGGIKAVSKGVGELVPKLESIMPKNLASKAIDIVSADPEAKVATILKESRPEELSNYVQIAQKAAQDPRLATPFEVVGNKLTDTAKVLEQKLSEIGKAKSDIIQPLREGLGAFKEETTPLIQKLTSLKNSFGEIENGSKSTVQAVINDAKTISTKLDADTFIDKVQNAIYSGNKDMTIPQGSSLDKQLRGIIGEYNSKLKSTLPEEYSLLNDRYSNLVGTLRVISDSLGQTVEGVPTKGASLIKQFFSPSGTKAKEIFDFVKKETNGEIDLAKDATLAKFTMELFDDPRARSLLQGIGDIPTTVGGVVSKVAEKVGGAGLKKAMVSSTVRKATKITLPK